MKKIKNNLISAVDTSSIENSDENLAKFFNSGAKFVYRCYPIGSSSNYTSANFVWGIELKLNFNCLGNAAFSDKFKRYFSEILELETTDIF